MTSQTSRPEERLAEALRREADQVPLSADPLGQIQARVRPSGTTHRPERFRRLVLGLSAVGLAAAVSLVVGLVVRQ